MITKRVYIYDIGMHLKLNLIEEKATFVERLTIPVCRHGPGLSASCMQAVSPGGKLTSDGQKQIKQQTDGEGRG